MVHEEEKCSNCGKPNLIDRPWRSDVFCGWCGTEYHKAPDGKLIVLAVKNTHLTARQKERRESIESHKPCKGGIND